MDHRERWQSQVVLLLSILSLLILSFTSLPGFSSLSTISSIPYCFLEFPFPSVAFAIQPSKGLVLLILAIISHQQ